MLQSLKVKNVALIEEVNIDFSEGLNVLTGETGAGKSILVDSLGVILGDRVSPDLIRHGSEELRVEGTFALSSQSGLKETLDSFGIPAEEDTLILARRVSRAGKNTVWANGWQIPVATLRSLGKELVQVHAQHDTHEIFSSSFALETLDQSNEELMLSKKQYQQRYEQWQSLLNQKEEMEREEAGRKERLEIISWQIQELSEANLNVEEEKNLEQYILIASNASRISESINSAYQFLNGEDASVLLNLSKGIKELSASSKYDPRLEEIAAELQECYFRIEEISYDLRDRRMSMDFNPMELEEKQKRIDKFYRLRKKYGMTTEELITKLADLIDESEKLSSFEDRKEELEKKIDQAFLQVQETGKILTAKREVHGKEWETLIETSVKDLAMPEARFVVEILATNSWGPSGQDEVDFLFSANIGQPPQSLRKIASGGELSRVSLAIQSISAARKLEKTLIFDEIDSGIGGQTASAVGRKMRDLAKKNQILSITHLPQIAVFAENQFMIKKVVKNQQTYTEVEKLNREDRISELARMLSGEASQIEAREMALKMLEQAENDGLKLF